MINRARGYIASGEFNGNRMPQHLQNQLSNHIAIRMALSMYYLVLNIGLMEVLNVNYGRHLKKALRILFFLAFGSYLIAKKIEKKYMNFAIPITSFCILLLNLFM